jgi:hypothetical protein
MLNAVVDEDGPHNLIASHELSMHIEAEPKYLLLNRFDLPLIA